MQNLIPCPLCGWSVKWIERDNTLAIECQTCGLIWEQKYILLAKHQLRALMTESWNKRQKEVEG